MSLVHIIVLALVQGITEFLPISSSAHLVLVPVVLGWPDQGLAFDVAVHVGTLAAVLWYFRGDLGGLWTGFWRMTLRRETNPEGRLAWGVLLGTIPVGLAGLLFEDIISTVLRSPLVIATTSIVFGLALWAADVRGKRQRAESAIGWKDVAVIGLAQAVALIPGTSRSGITITAGLMLGLTRTAAARFSFLLAIPVYVLAGGLKTVELVRTPEAMDWNALAWGVGLSAVASYACIRLFLAWISRRSMLPFVIYRLLLGVLLLIVFV